MALLSRFGSSSSRFHHLDHLWNRAFSYLVAPIFKRLVRIHYCVQPHANKLLRPIVAAVVLRRFRGSGSVHVPQKRPRFRCRVSYSSIPPPLDVDKTSRPQLVLPMLWKHAIKQPFYPCR